MGLRVDRIPANSARYHTSRSSALNADAASITLSIDPIESIIYNQDFDSKLIKYDELYQTQIPSLSYSLPESWPMLCKVFKN
jgi:hypothetical protein